MDFEQLIKRLDWLDEERRKDKATIAVLEERLNGLEGDLKAAAKKVKDVNTSLTKVSGTSSALTHLETALSNLRTELTKYVDIYAEQQHSAGQEADKRYQLQFKSLNKWVTELGKLKSTLAELKRDFAARTEDDTRRNKKMADWEGRMQTQLASAEEIHRSQKVLEEGRKTEAKRVLEMQGEISTARKRQEEVRSKVEILAEELHRLEARLTELLANEADRKQAQVNFIETQRIQQVEHDRLWKEWETSLESLTSNSTLMERRLQDWEVAQRSVKRAQETYDDLVQKFERRINEISEMQRLAEDRFRQEWVTFKADEQKRWASFTLTQDEIRNDLRDELAKLHSSLTGLGDQLQTQQDILEQTKDANQQLFQGMLSHLHELLAAYERIMSTR